MLIKRTLSESEKQEVLKQHGRRCFVDGEPVNEVEILEFHHIKPFSEDGPTNIDNIAPVCRKHHLTIGTMSLQEYRDKLELSRFFEDGELKYLDDLVRYKKRDYGKKMNFDVAHQHISLYFDNLRHDFPLHTCPTKKWKYFYATLPVEYILNDRDLQPRALREPSLWGLYRHFQTNTQLAPSICRIDDQNNILLFDGQHKAAAQIWAGRPMIECKVYLHPDAKELKETNLAAHGLFRQMSFYSHELMNKYYDIFKEDWTNYMNTEGVKSEFGFFNFLIHTGKKKAEAKNEIAMAIYNEIIEDKNNKLSVYRSEKHRGRKQPLTFARIKKTFFQHMLVPPPVKEEFESDSDFRKEERYNLVKLMNIIAEEGLEGKWAPERGDAAHKKADRIFSAGAIRAWVILLRDVINTHLKHYDDEDKQIFFYRKITDDDFRFFRNFVKKIFSHKIWDDPDPQGEIAARLAKDDAMTAKNLFKEKGLTVSWVLNL